MSRMTKGAVFAAALMLWAVSLPQAQAASGGPSDEGTARTAVGPKVALGLRPTVASAAGSGLALGPDEVGTERSRVADPDGTTYVHYDRTWQGKRVLGGDFIATVNASGVVSEITWSRGLAKVTPDRTVRLSSAQAQAAPTHQAGLRGSSASAELVVWAATGSPRMAYDVLTVGIRPDQTPMRLHTIVDAVSGATLTSYDEVFTGTGHSEYSGTVTLNTTKPASVWQLKDVHGNYTTNLAHATSGTGTLFTDADNVWGTGSASDVQTAAVDAEFGAEKTFAFYLSVLGRNGIWGTGRGARSRVHFGDGYVNAFWDGTQMTYGDGENNARPLTSLDVAAHEMTHGVTTNSAGLLLTQEARGLNESVSDIMATAVEFWANVTADKGDYLIGEKINIFGTGAPLRYLDRPSRDGNSPNCYSTSTGTLDEHYGAGPLNHWFYLLAEGSGAKTINGVAYNSPTCDGKAITGIGRDAATKIVYRALTTKLTSASNYVTMRDGAVASARELYGADSRQCSTVSAAFNAISVPAGTQTCSGTVPAAGTNMVKNPGFETGLRYWNDMTKTVVLPETSSRLARSGSWRAWLGGWGKAFSENLDQMVSIPAQATSVKLTLYIASDTSDYTSSVYDKMRVQVLVGNVAKTVVTFTNMGTDPAYRLKTYDLTAYKGQVVTLRFTMTEDASYQTSWLVDDIGLSYS